MAGHDIVVIGASAGGLQALQVLLRNLPQSFPASVFIVVHTSPGGTGMLAAILSKSSGLTVVQARNGQVISRGKVYVAPPDHHLLINSNRVQVTRGPKENGFRPAVDPLFRTAANTYGKRVVGVVLSGNLDDGTQGLFQIKRDGGMAIAQDPLEATFPSMPASAAENVQVDYVLRVVDIAARLIELAGGPRHNEARTMARTHSNKQDIAEVGTSALKDHLRPAPPSRFTCPECGGAVWELKAGNLLQYRCHVGHGYTADALMDAQNESVEAALWTALRTLEENAEMRRRMADHAQKRQLDALTELYRSMAEETESRATVIRRVLVNDNKPPENGKDGNRSNGRVREKKSKVQPARSKSRR
jgi:two-component system chemotaxis response regulator CheB